MNYTLILNFFITAFFVYVLFLYKDMVYWYEVYLIMIGSNIITYPKISYRIFNAIFREQK